MLTFAVRTNAQRKQSPPPRGLFRLMTPPDHIRLIAQEWRILLQRLDSAIPGWRRESGHLAECAISQTDVLDRTITEAVNATNQTTV